MSDVEVVIQSPLDGLSIVIKWPIAGGFGPAIKLGGVKRPCQYTPVPIAV